MAHQDCLPRHQPIPQIRPSQTMGISQRCRAQIPSRGRLVFTRAHSLRKRVRARQCCPDARAPDRSETWDPAPPPASTSNPAASPLVMAQGSDSPPARPPARVRLWARRSQKWTPYFSSKERHSDRLNRPRAVRPKPTPLQLKERAPAWTAELRAREWSGATDPTDPYSRAHTRDQSPPHE